MKKILFLLAFGLFIYGAIPVNATTMDDIIDGCMEGFRETWEKSKRDDEPKLVSIEADGTLITEDVPKITNEHVKKAVDKKINEQIELIKNTLIDYQPFSEQEAQGIISTAREVFEIHSTYNYFYWNDSEVVLSGYNEAKVDTSIVRWITNFRKNQWIETYDKTISADDPSGWAYDSVMSAIENGYVPNHLQSSYRSPITREEFAELFVTAVFADFNKTLPRAFQETQDGWEFETVTIDNFLSKVATSESFTDTHNKYIKVANILGMVNGVGHRKFDPNGLITREQAAVMFMNYFQTIESTGTKIATLELDDLDEASSWAKEAVARAYGVGYLKGTRAVISKGGYIEKKGYFDTKGTFTREQAITVVSRLGKGEKDNLHFLLLRGYVKINMDLLMSGFEIEGDTVKMLNSNFDSEYSEIKQFLRMLPDLADYCNEFSTSQLNAVIITPPFAAFDRLTKHHLDKILSGKQTLYDFKIFTIEHNKNGYLAIIDKTPGYGYYSGGAPCIQYGWDNEFTINGIEVK